MEKDCDKHARGKQAFIFEKEPGIKGSIYEKTEGQIDAWAGGRKARTKAVRFNTPFARVRGGFFGPVGRSADPVGG